MSQKIKLKSKEDFSHIAENDALRSECIQKLVQKPLSSQKRHNATGIPKIIIQFWNDLGNVPEDVQECLDSWKPLIEQNFKRIVFDEGAARDFIYEQFGTKNIAAFDLCHHPAMRCDYFRLCYLLKAGGFYVDADEVYQGSDLHSFFIDDHLKIQPLCYDILSGEMIPTCIFLKQDAYSSDWIFYVNNNPIITPPDHPIIQLALERATSILLSRTEKRSDIQSTTGPGNLSACLVRHWNGLEYKGNDQDFDFLYDWDSFSISKWPLSYRNDKRNWRIWNSLIFQGKADT